jgi:ankyrin repeat protein
MLAAKEGNAQIVSEILKYYTIYHISLNETERGGNTALMLAAQSGHAKVIELLVKHGVKVDYVNKENGNTSLMCAIHFAHESAIKELINCGTNVNYINKKNKETPLKYCVRKAYDKDNPKAHYEQIVKLLLTNGAKINSVKGILCKVLLKAIREEDIGYIKLLLEKGVEADKVKYKGNNFIILNILNAQEYGDSLCTDREKALLIEHSEDTKKIIIGRLEHKLNKNSKEVIKLGIDSLRESFREGIISKEVCDSIIKLCPSIREYSIKETILVFLIAKHSKGYGMNLLPTEILLEIAKYASSTGYTFWKARKPIFEKTADLSLKKGTDMDIDKLSEVYDMDTDIPSEALLASGLLAGNEEIDNSMQL